MGLAGSAMVEILKDPLAELSTMAGLSADRGADLLLGGGTLTSVPGVLDGYLALGVAPPGQPAAERRRIWRFRTGGPAKELRMNPATPPTV